MNTIEIKVEGYDLVMVREGREFQCAIYRTGKMFPLARKLIATQDKAEAWFHEFISKLGA
jgi:hypothetical protein